MRRIVSIFLLAFVAAACGSNSDIDQSASDRSGDGALDCLEGEIGRTFGEPVFADSEIAAVEAALETWIEAGAEVFEIAEDESWGATLGGRDVALAIPEREGDGRWTVTALVVCGLPAAGPAEIDGSLDCSDDTGWSIEGMIDSSIPGAESAQTALLEALAPYKGRHGGEVVLRGESGGSLVVGQSEQVVASAFEVDAGGWIVASISGCGGFE